MYLTFHLESPVIFFMLLCSSYLVCPLLLIVNVATPVSSLGGLICVFCLVCPVIIFIFFEPGMKLLT